MCIIYLFNFIPKIQNAFAKKKAAEVPVAAAPVAAPVVEEVEEADDLELVAVIAAAIAAYEGQTSTDGFVVRSIKKSKRR
jgi:sodium pump decarboxylase gamma subunit